MTELTAFSRAWLRDRGFRGFVRLSNLDMDQVPQEQGVYVLLRESQNAPEYLDANPGGHHKGRDPTEDRDVLRARWVDDCHCIYIGKADKTSPKRGLRKRLTEFREFGRGMVVGHWGGRYVWQLADASGYVVAWKLTIDPPQNVEDELLTEFESLHGRLPFANIKRPRRRAISM